MTTPYLSLSNVSYDTPQKSILSDISFDLLPNDSLALLGENGAGKSTLIDIVLNDIKPTKGKVVYAQGKNKKKIGVVYDHLPLFPLLKVKEVIHYFALIHQIADNDTQKHYAQALGIDHIYESLLSKLSQGEKKKVAILLAIMHQPDLIVLDEPFANIDPTIVQIIWKLLKQPNRTLLFTTHNWHEAETQASKVAFLYKGRLLCPPQHPKTLLTQTFTTDRKVVVPQIAAIEQQIAHMQYYAHNNQLHIMHPQRSEIMTAIKTHTNNFSVVDTSLEDVYFWLKNN